MKRVLLTIGIVTLAIFTTAAVFAQPISRSITGNDYRQFPEDMKLGYAMGVFHGLVAATIIVANPDPSLPFTPTATAQQPPPGTMLYSCLINMTNGQVQAIIDKYIADHPAEWHHPLPDIAIKAVVLPCLR